MFNKEMLGTLVNLTRAGMLDSTLYSKLQSFPQVFGHELIFKDAVKETEKRKSLFFVFRENDLQVYLAEFIMKDAG